MSTMKSHKEARPALSKPLTKPFIDLSEIDDRVLEKSLRLAAEKGPMSTSDWLKALFPD